MLPYEVLDNRPRVSKPRVYFFEFSANFSGTVITFKVVYSTAARDRVVSAAARKHATPTFEADTPILCLHDY